nr:hypothetical protein [Tanacetum cinerariifolium]
VSHVSETLKKDLEDLFHNFYDGYFDASKIMKSSAMNAETSNIEIPSNEEEVFHESSESFQEESSSLVLHYSYRKASLSGEYELELDKAQQFSAARTPQQNAVVKRRNRTLVEAARTKLTFYHCFFGLKPLQQLVSQKSQKERPFCRSSEELMKKIPLEMIRNSHEKLLPHSKEFRC